MNRARAGTWGSVGPAFLLVATFLVAACGSALQPSSSSEPILTPLPSGALISIAPTPSSTATTSGTPASPSAGQSPAASPAVSPSPSGRDAAAAACSGSNDTRDFFAAIAEAVAWDVYCAVVPAGWSVDPTTSNTYHLGNSGRMAIAYRSQAGGHFELHEGAWCADSGSGCVAAGSDGGTAPFGARSGALIVLDGGGYALAVDRGAKVSWVAIGRGIDEATFRALCVGLALVKA